LFASKKRFGNIASTNPNCYGDNFSIKVTTVIIVVTIQNAGVKIKVFITTVLVC